MAATLDGLLEEMWARRLLPPESFLPRVRVTPDLAVWLSLRPCPPERTQISLAVAKVLTLSSERRTDPSFVSSAS